MTSTDVAVFHIFLDDIKYYVLPSLVLSCFFLINSLRVFYKIKSQPDMSFATACRMARYAGKFARFANIIGVVSFCIPAEVYILFKKVPEDSMILNQYISQDENTTLLLFASVLVIGIAACVIANNIAWVALVRARKNATKDVVCYIPPIETKVRLDRIIIKKTTSKGDIETYSPQAEVWIQVLDFAIPISDHISMSAQNKIHRVIRLLEEASPKIKHATRSVLNAHDITHPIDIKNLDLHPELEECIRGILEGPKLTSEEFAFYDSDLAQRPDRLAIY